MEKERSIKQKDHSIKTLLLAITLAADPTQQQLVRLHNGGNDRADIEWVLATLQYAYAVARSVCEREGVDMPLTIDEIADIIHKAHPQEA